MWFGLIGCFSEAIIAFSTILTTVKCRLQVDGESAEREGTVSYLTLPARHARECKLRGDGC